MQGDLIPPSMCIDNYGQYILPGKRFQPISSDHCTQCVCLNGKAENCLTINCQPPDNCKKSAILQKKGSCCEFICLDPDEEDVDNKLLAASNRLISSNKDPESTINHLNQLNDLDTNGNVHSSSIHSSIRGSSNLQNNVKSIDVDNVANNEQANLKINLNKNDLKSNLTASNEKRYSNLESTLKKLMKNIKNEEALKNSTAIVKSDKLDDQKHHSTAFQNLGIGVGIGMYNI